MAKKAMTKKQSKTDTAPNGKEEPQQADWVTDKTSEPQAWTPSEEETQAWGVAVMTADDEPVPQSPEEAISKLDNAPKWDGDWTGQGKKKKDPTQLAFEASSEGTFLVSPVTVTEEGIQDGWPNTGDAQDAGDWDMVNPQENVLLNIETHSGTFDQDTFKLMIYGETGTQKTRTAATFPGVLFVDVDHGMSSVDRQVAKQYVPDDASGFKVAQAIYDYLARGGHDYDTVVIDTLNELQRVIMRYTVDEYTHIRRSYGNLPGQSDYGKMLYEFMELTRAYISLPMKVILLAQVNSQQFETDTLGPQLIGKNTSRELCRKMDIIGYIYKAEGTEETFPEMTFDSPSFVTKDRSNRLPVALQYPTYARMSAYWK